MDYIELRYVEKYEQFMVYDSDSNIYATAQHERYAYQAARELQRTYKKETGVRLPIRQYCANGNYLEL